MRINSAKELEVYKKSYGLSMEIFQLSKKFPSEEKFALTNQIRRSSQSVSMNLREAWAKRRYEAHFVSKLTDCDGPRLSRAYGSESENAETETSLDFALDCEYLTADQHAYLVESNHEIGRMLGSMSNNPTPFLITK